MKAMWIGNGLVKSHRWMVRRCGAGIFDLRSVRQLLMSRAGRALALLLTLLLLHLDIAPAVASTALKPRTARPAPSLPPVPLSVRFTRWLSGLLPLQRLQATPPLAPAPGLPPAWGASASVYGGVVNLGNGNLCLQVPLVGWANGVSFSLVFNSQANPSQPSPKFSIPRPEPQPEPLPIPPPICDNCHLLVDIVTECAHFTPDPTEPCSRNLCIVNTIITSTCDYKPLGDPNRNLCNAWPDPDAWMARQELRLSQCTTFDTGDYHTIHTIYIDCVRCASLDLRARCLTFPQEDIICMMGVLIATAERTPRYTCIFPCPPSEGGEEPGGVR